jgi:hypothetical protein
LTRQYQEAAKSIFLTQSGTSTGTGRKKTHGELQEKISGLWTNCCLFEKGIKHFTGKLLFLTLSKCIISHVID